MASAPAVTAAAPAVHSPPPDLAAVTRAYRNLREARLELEKKMEKEIAVLKEQQDAMGAILLAHLNSTNSESARTEEGTFYRTLSVKPSIVDDLAFFKWVKDNDAFDSLERRVKKGFIVEYQKENAEALPPGIAVYKEYEVRVRKPA
jgi:hypothetical protein